MCRDGALQVLPSIALQARHIGGTKTRLCGCPIQWQPLARAHRKACLQAGYRALQIVRPITADTLLVSKTQVVLRRAPFRSLLAREYRESCAERGDGTLNVVGALASK